MDLTELPRKQKEAQRGKGVIENKIVRDVYTK